MKKKVSAKLLAALLATSTILSGCGAQETISMGTGSMQTSSMEESVKGEKPDTVEITDIQWIMKDGAEFWHKYGSQSDEGFAIDEGMIVGKVVYSDGNEMEIEPENVTGTLMGYGNSCKINITYRDRMYEVTSLNPWGDSEDPDALAAANSGRQVLIPSGSGSDGVSGSVVLNPEGTETVSNTETSDSTQGTYSIADCPELTNLDWDEFNKVVEVYIPDLFSIIGADPRVDWSEVNDHFNEYYSGSEGIGDFYSDMLGTYVQGRDDRMCWMSVLCIEPYSTRLEENYKYYDELYDKVYAEAYADEISERNKVLKGYPSYVDMLIGEGYKTCGDDLDALARYTAMLVEGYLNSEDEFTYIDGSSVMEDLKLDYGGAFRCIDDQVLSSCVVVDGEDIVDADFSKYITFHDAVQGYLGDKASYAELVHYDIDMIRNFKWGDDISSIYKY